MGRRIPGRIGQIESQVYGSNSLLTDPQSYLSEEDRALADALGVGAGQVTAGQVRDAEAEVGNALARQKQIDVEAGQARQNTEKQALVENVIAGLGKALAGVLGEQQGFSSEGVNIKTSDFGQLLAGRMQEIAEKRKTAQSEMESAERRKADLFGAGRRQLELKQMSAKDRNEMVFRAMLQEHFMNKEEALKRELEDQRNKEKEAAETAGTIAALTQSIQGQYSDIMSKQKTLTENLGDLRNKDKSKVLEAKRKIASTLGESPAAYEALETAAIDARVSEYKQSLETTEKALQSLSDNLAFKTSNKTKFKPEEYEAVSALRAGLSATSVAGKKLGEIEISKPENMSFGQLIQAANAEPSIAKAFSQFVNEIKSDGFFKDSDAINIIQKKVQTGRMKELTEEELQLLNSYRGANGTGNGFTSDFLNYPTTINDKPATVAQKLSVAAKLAAQKKQYKVLNKLAPGSSVNVVGFGTK